LTVSTRLDAKLETNDTGIPLTDAFHKVVALDNCGSSGVEDLHISSPRIARIVLDKASAAIEAIKWTRPRDATQGVVLQQRFGTYQSGDGSVGLSKRSPHRLLAAGKPTDNAFVESFNGTFRAECLDVHWFVSIAEAKQLIEGWRREYNESRPHRVLGEQSPSEFASRFASQRELTGLQEPENSP